MMACFVELSYSPHPPMHNTCLISILLIKDFLKPIFYSPMADFRLTRSRHLGALALAVLQVETVANDGIPVPSLLTRPHRVLDKSTAAFAKFKSLFMCSNLSCQTSVGAMLTLAAIANVSSIRWGETKKKKPIVFYGRRLVDVEIIIISQVLPHHIRSNCN